MNGYLLDSDIIIWHLRGRQEVVRLLERLAGRGELGASAVSVLEVQAGVKAGEEEQTNTFLEGLTCWAVDRGIANQAGEYMRTYKARGITLDFADSLVAATVVLHDLTLVTKNVSHYPMPELRLLGEES
ncbi:MAG: type II toxin-antitoxin system VapC family toxin [Chloroflexi bacterium]|nr:type II toxin-antitoxin system VapC family toxin [Chloroflexota bacterium]MCL5074466.1 type II toxin-antitoxin system VapC family toxin [Chloroflexota bacterium]